MQKPPPRLLSAILLLAISCSAHAVPIRVATFNVEVGLGGPGSAGFENSAAVLQRIGADVVAMQELINDSGNLAAMGARLGLPHPAYQSSSSMQVGLLSRYPIAEANWVFRTNEMTRPILLARIDVPNVARDPWIAVVHLKCCNTNPLDQYTRAVELHYLRKEIDQRTGTNDPVLIMGDFNLVAPTGTNYPTGPEGITNFAAPASADGYFIPQGIFKLDARHAGTGGETWTWRSNGQFPSGPLDHIMVNDVVRARGTAVEIYNAEEDAAGSPGLPKQGTSLAAPLAYTSDHLPIFADFDLEDGNPPPANLMVDAAGALAAEGPIGGPFTSSEGIYTLRNTGSQPLEWTAQNDAHWISLPAMGGILGPGESVNVAAGINSSAASLAAGQKSAFIRFSNQSNGLGTTLAPAALLIGSFLMDGEADSSGYTVESSGITLRVALRGTRLYVATQSTGYGEVGGKDHHVFVADSLLPAATAPAPWAKRGFTALPEARPFLAAEGANDYAGWFNAKNPTRLSKAPNSAGVLEGVIDLVEQFGTVPEFVYVAAVAYETSDASAGDPLRGRVLSQVPAAKQNDDNITPDEFLRVPVRSVSDSYADGKFDILAPDRAFRAALTVNGSAHPPQIRWNAVPGRAYRLWRCSDLMAGNWQAFGEITAASGEWEAAVTDTVGGNRGFYRVELLGQGF